MMLVGNQLIILRSLFIDKFFFQSLFIDICSYKSWYSENLKSNTNGWYAADMEELIS